MMRRPRVLNKRTATLAELADVVYVGRPSRWGNPYKIGDLMPGTRRRMTRDDTIRLHRQLFLKSDKDQADARRLLRGRNLVCWCWPLPCHADIQLEVANAD